MSVRLLRNVRCRARALRHRTFPRWGFGTARRLRSLRRHRGYGVALAGLLRTRRRSLEVSRKLLEDAATDLEAWIAAKIAGKTVRAKAAAFVVGGRS